MIHIDSSYPHRYKDSTTSQFFVCALPHSWFVPHLSWLVVACIPHSCWLFVPRDHHFSHLFCTMSNWLVVPLWQLVVVTRWWLALGQSKLEDVGGAVTVSLVCLQKPWAPWYKGTSWNFLIFLMNSETFAKILLISVYLVSALSLCQCHVNVLFVAFEHFVFSAIFKDGWLIDYVS